VRISSISSGYNMRVSSILSSSIRVAPRQERSARRLRGFLEVAAELFGDVGFEATTMQAIADRSNSSIGALYNYFPDKQSVAATLRLEYAKELQARLESLLAASAKLSAPQFAESFIECMANFARERPAWLNLHTVPIPATRSRTARKDLRLSIAHAFRVRNPSLSSERALLAAKVTIQIVKGMKTLYLESEMKSRGLIEGEFRKVLTWYLEGVLSRSRTD
jgi:AcrR family transcriptional regulator